MSTWFINAPLGNDETSQKSQLSSVIDRIFSQVKQDKTKKSVSQRHRRMAALLRWAGKEKNCESALDRILQPVPSGKQREDARKIIQSGMESYFFLHEPEDCQIQFDFGKAEFIKEKFSCGILPNWTLDIIRNKQFYFQSQVECKEEKSTISVCLPIISKIAEILLQESDLDITIIAREEGKKLNHIKIDSESEKIFVEDPIEFWVKNCDVSKMELASVILWTLSENHQNFKSETKANFDRFTIHSLSNFQAILYFSNVFDRITSRKPVLNMRNWSGIAIFDLIHRFATLEEFQGSLENDIKLEFCHKFEKYSNWTSSRVNREIITKRRRSKKAKEETRETLENLDKVQDSQDETEEILDNRFSLLSLE